MEYTKSLKNKAKELDAPVQYMIMADLILLGYGETDAYNIAYHSENAAYSVQRNKALRENVLKSPRFQDALAARREQITNAGVRTREYGTELIGAEETAKEILKVAQSMPENSKERGEMFMKYADLIRKNEAVAVDEDPIRIYLPIQCDLCPLLASYNEYKKDHQQEQITPVEMESIVAKANFHQEAE